MGAGSPNHLTRLRLTRAAGLAVVAGLLVPVLITVVLGLLRARFNFQYLFLYFPGILFLSYAGGLVAGMTGAVASTLLGLFYLMQSSDLTLPGIVGHGLPVALFLFTATVIAITGDRYRAYKEQLRSDLKAAAHRARIEGLVVRVTDLLGPGAARRRLSDAICKACAETLGHRCAIVLAKPRSRDLYLDGFHTVARGEKARAEGRLSLARALLSDAGAFSRRVLGQTDVVRVTVGGSDADDAAVLVEQLAREGLHAALFAPMRSGEDALGYLAVMAERSVEWDADDLRSVKTIADRLTGAIVGQRRREQRIRRERNSRLLAEVMVAFFKDQTLPGLLQTVARSCVDALGEWCGVSVLDPGSPVARLDAVHHPDPARAREIEAAHERATFARDNPLAMPILENQEPLVLTQDTPDIGEMTAAVPFVHHILHGSESSAALVVPIVVGGKSLGTLAIPGTSARPWEDEDLTLAAGIADRAGAAIANLRLIDLERRARQEAEREAQRMEAINRTVAIAAGSLDPDTVFDQFAAALRLLVPFDHVSVALPAADRDWLSVPYFWPPASSEPRDLLEGPRTGTARAHVMGTGHGYVGNVASTKQAFEEDRRFASVGIRSYMIVPMRVGDQAIGTLTFGHREPGFYTEGYAKLVLPVADHLGVTISHSQLFEQMQRHAGELSETLQRALLPADLPSAPFVTLGALYQSADPDAKIGGDWYDAFVLPDGTILLSIGDITGRGLSAAAAMGQVRHIVRAYALQHRAPGETMSAVNDFVMHTPERWQLSVWIGIVDPYSGELRYTGAGHPPPVVVRHGSVSYLDGQGPLLGLMSKVCFSEQRCALAPGTRLVLYTDGLIEASRNVVDGERRLAEAAEATVGVPPHRAVQALVNRVLGGANPRDDVALLVVDTLPAGAPLWLSLPAIPENLWRIRRAVAAFATRHALPADIADSMVAAVGEAASNAVEHAYRGAAGRIVVRAEHGGDRVTISVRDFGQWRLPMERGRGRGTRIMQGFADTAGSATGPAGTSVDLSWALAGPQPPR